MKNSKLLILGLIFLIIFMSGVSISVMNKNNAISISDMQSDYVMEKLEEEFLLLQDTVSMLAHDKNVIDALRQSHLEARSYQQDLTTNIKIVSNIIEMPWFEPFMMSSQTAVITNVYEDAGREVISVIEFVINDKELLGAVVSDIFLDDLFANLKDDYHIGDINITIESNGVISSSSEQLTEYTSMNTKEYTLLGTKIKFTLEVDLSSISISGLKQSTITTTLLFTVGVLIAVAILLAAILMPISSSAVRLNNIAHEIDDEYDTTDTRIIQINETTKFIENNLPNKLKYLMYYDELTGLVNRKMFRIIYRTFTSNDKPFVVMLLDIKNFKNINDTCGTAVGDRVLIDISLRLNMTMALTSKEGVVIRCSGDEFMIVLHHEDLDIEKWYESKILSLFVKPLQYPDTKPIAVEFNCAAIVTPKHANSEADLMNKLYIMITKAKELNTTSLVMFNSEVYSKYVERERIKNCLKTSIAANEFVVNYQPIIDEDKNIKKAEALIRWFSKDLGFVRPDQFISIAEQTGLIIELGNWIIERVAKDLRSLFDSGRFTQVSINISAIQLMEENFVRTSKAILDKYDIDYKYICFEITESILLQEINTVKNNIKELRELGIAFALDDFGTGYSSFSYLKEYSLDIIKIDRMFVDNATEKEFAIITGIKHISNALGMQMVIEGVETQEQFDALNHFGLIQGYYFSRPVVWDEFEKMLT
ncbi:MAG: hypothetical protein ATN34_01735 [Epulopiscium sp. Nele67-Bin002]|nr:MAG: hypothetical protein ATN34_01735 [Epulopiscium sp. Nele67-Bin002]